MLMTVRRASAADPSMISITSAGGWLEQGREAGARGAGGEDGGGRRLWKFVHDAFRAHLSNAFGFLE